MESSSRRCTGALLWRHRRMPTPPITSSGRSRKIGRRRHEEGGCRALLLLALAGATGVDVGDDDLLLVLFPLGARGLLLLLVRHEADLCLHLDRHPREELCELLPELLR